MPSWLPHRIPWERGLPRWPLSCLFFALELREVDGLAKEYSDYMAPLRKKEKPRFDGYTGNKIWRVSHPDHGEIEVFAPSLPAAIAAAAKVWGRRWQEYAFYADCSVVPCGVERKGKAR